MPRSPRRWLLPLIFTPFVMVQCDDDDEESREPAADAGRDAAIRPDATVDAAPDVVVTPAPDGATFPEGGATPDAADGAPEAGDAGLARAPRRIEVIVTGDGYNPSKLFAEPGAELIVVLRNESDTPRGIAFELPGDIEQLETDVPPQETRELRFTVPEEPGDSVFRPPGTDGSVAGFQGTLTVRVPPSVALRQVASGLTSPVAMAMPDDGTGRRFIVDQVGQIWILMPDGTLLDEPFIDIAGQLVELDPSYDERGLLGLAFHPDYDENGRFYVYYSAPLRPSAPNDWNNTSIISEFRTSSDPNRADADSERILLRVDEPQSNHAGGSLAFGPGDGMLYISLGDGGGAGDIGLGHTDELGNAQDTSKLLGSILRLDVDTASPYGIPPDNPFVGADGEDEIFAYGFRNPYRMSFDMAGEGSLFVGDAGQELWEEVSRVELGGNYGWHVLEGTHCFNPDDFDDPPATCPEVGAGGSTLQWPVVEIPHVNQEGGLGLVVVGGYVYRGSALTELAGRYVFGTWSQSEADPSALLLVASDEDGAGGDLWPVERVSVLGDPDGNLGRFLLGFGQDLDGEMYVLTTDTVGPTGSTGMVFQLSPTD